MIKSVANRSKFNGTRGIITRFNYPARSHETGAYFPSHLLVFQCARGLQSVRGAKAGNDARPMIILTRKIINRVRRPSCISVRAITHRIMHVCESRISYLQFGNCFVMDLSVLLRAAYYKLTPRSLNIHIILCIILIAVSRDYLSLPRYLYRGIAKLMAI